MKNVFEDEFQIGGDLYLVCGDLYLVYYMIFKAFHVLPQHSKLSRKIADSPIYIWTKYLTKYSLILSSNYKSTIKSPNVCLAFWLIILIIW